MRLCREGEREKAEKGVFREISNEMKGKMIQNTSSAELVQFKYLLLQETMCCAMM